MFFLKKIFQKNLNIDEIEDLLFDNGVEPKFADLIISKIKENNSQEEDIKKVIKESIALYTEAIIPAITIIDATKLKKINDFVWLKEKFNDITIN